MRALLLLALPMLACAESPLEAIHAILAPMRTSHAQGLKARGATPAFTDVKHRLRDWIESRITVLKWNGQRWTPSPTVLQEQLNEELSHADLFCGESEKTPCPDQSELGFLGRIGLDMEPGTLIVTTGIGIEECGEDQSAYAYRSENDHWSRIWQTEQNDYRDGRYFPQWLRQVKISGGKAAYLILTMGTEPWCSSVWHNIYYRVWQTGTSYPEPKSLLDESRGADVFAPINGSVLTDGVLMEYRVAAGLGYRQSEIRHYLIRNDKLERVDPVALSPDTFTTFWLTRPWEEISRWTAQAVSAELKGWLGQKRDYGEFPEEEATALHCLQHPDLWQTETQGGADGKAYFLIRWRPPYHFTMMAVRDHPWPDCTEADPAAEEPLPLFPPD